VEILKNDPKENGIGRKAFALKPRKMALASIYSPTALRKELEDFKNQRNQIDPLNLPLRIYLSSSTDKPR